MQHLELIVAQSRYVLTDIGFGSPGMFGLTKTNGVLLRAWDFLKSRFESPVRTPRIFMANSEAMKAAQLRHYRRNREDILAALKKYYKKNLPYTRIASRKQVRRWVKKNRKKWNRYVQTRRILIRNKFWRPYSRVRKYQLA